MKKILTCAIRKRYFIDSSKHVLEIGNDIANAITSFDKDSMIIIIYDG